MKIRELLESFDDDNSVDLFRDDLIEIAETVRPDFNLLSDSLQETVLEGLSFAVELGLPINSINFNWKQGLVEKVLNVIEDDNFVELTEYLYMGAVDELEYLTEAKKKTKKTKKQNPNVTRSSSKYKEELAKDREEGRPVKKKVPYHNADGTKFDTYKEIMAGRKAGGKNDKSILQLGSRKLKDFDNGSFQKHVEELFAKISKQKGSEDAKFNAFRRLGGALVNIFVNFSRKVPKYSKLAKAGLTHLRKLQKNSAEYQSLKASVTTAKRLAKKQSQAVVKGVKGGKQPSAFMPKTSSKATADRIKKLEAKNKMKAKKKSASKTKTKSKR